MTLYGQAREDRRLVFVTLNIGVTIFHFMFVNVQSCSNLQYKYSNSDSGFDWNVSNIKMWDCNNSNQDINQSLQNN